MPYPIKDAIIADDIDKVKRLLEETPELINQVVPFYDGKTPIHFAKSIEMLQVLIDMGADINTQTYRCDTPLMSFNYFGYRNFSELILFLINYGADVNIINNEGRSILDFYITKIQYISNEGLNDPTTNTIYKLLLNKSDKFFDTRIYEFYRHSHNYLHIVDIQRSNLLKKNNVILPFLVTHPEAFDKMYARPDHPTERYSEYLRRIWNITFDELRSAAGEMARERRMPLLNTFLRARRARARPGVVAVAPVVHSGGGKAAP
jgi:ankyrin repeat protein